MFAPITVAASALALAAPLALPAPHVDARADASAAPAAASRLAIRADRALLTGGRTIEDVVILIEDGRIRSIDSGFAVPDGYPIVEHDGVVTAGFVLVGSTMGLREAYDDTRSLLPEARVIDGFDPSHPSLRHALDAGITTVVLAPQPSTVVPGHTAVVKTDGTVLSRDAHLCLALSASALDRNRYPTSIPGALQEIEQHLASREGTFGEVVSGRRPVLLVGSDRHEAQRACALAQKHGLQGVVRVGGLVGEIADVVAASGLGAVIGPFPAGTTTRARRAAVALAEAGVPLAFGDAPGLDPHELRLSAVRCVQAGMEPAVALDALTETAARLAGVGARVGSLERGRDADLVLWSGSPLDLTSSIEAVYVGGVKKSGRDGRTHGGAH